MANSKVILLRNATQPPTLQESMVRKSNNTWNSIRMMRPALGEWSHFIKVSGKTTLLTITWSAFVSRFKIQHVKIQQRSIDIVTPSSFHFLMPRHVPLKI